MSSPEEEEAAKEAAAAAATGDQIAAVTTTTKRKTERGGGGYCCCSAPRKVSDSSVEMQENGNAAVDPNNATVAYRTGRRARKCLIALVVILVLLSAGLVVAVLLQIYVFHNEVDLCTTDRCTVAGSTLILSIDRTVDPCTDFYAYTCGGYIRRHPLPDGSSNVDVFSDVHEKNLQKLKAVLEKPGTKFLPQAIMKARQAYLNCMNPGDVLGLLADVKSLFNELGGWPLAVGDSWNNRPNSTNFSLPQVMSKLLRIGMPNELIDIDVSNDLKDPSRRLIYFDQPDSTGQRTKTLFGRGRIIMRKLPDDDEDDDEDDANSTAKAIAAFASMLGNNNTASVNADIADMMKLKQDLISISTGQNERRNYTRLYNKMTIQQLNNVTNNRTDWLMVLNVIFKDIAMIYPSDEVIVGEVDYVRKLPDVLRKYSNRTVLNYMMWKVAHSLTMTIISQIPNFQPAKRWRTCISDTGDLFAFALTRLFVDKYKNDGVNPQVKVFVEKIQETTKEVIMQSRWLDEQTKQTALLKVDNMRKLIGFPDWILVDARLDEYYRDVVLNESHFRTMVNEMKRSGIDNLKALRLPVEKTDDDWGDDENPLKANAYNEITRNTIVVPIGILQAGFFDINNIAALNFGAIGSILGHELGHAFDDEGRQFDENGVLREWWQEESLRVYSDRSQCFVRQYNAFCPDEYKGDADNYTCVSLRFVSS